jgi:cytoskeletal protein RodZ
MNRRTTTSGRTDRNRHRFPVTPRRPRIFLGVAAAGAVLVNVLVTGDPAAQAEATTEPVSVAAQLGMTEAAPADGAPDLAPLEQLAASRSSREAAQTAAQQAQTAADQATVDQRQAEADAAARAAAEAAAAAEAEAAAQARAQAQAEAQAQAQAQAQAEAAAAAQAPVQQRTPAPASAAAPRSAAAATAAAVNAVARISNSAGGVKPQTQAAANVVVSNVPGAAGITLGGTRASATDPGGHPSGLALDYMVLKNRALGDAIAQYHIDHWDSLGVEYVIWQQRILTSPNGSWKPMADRGSPTENHMDHVHVNYR